MPITIFGSDQMATMKEVEQLVRSGRLALPDNPPLRNLFLWAATTQGFDPTKNLSAEYDQEVSRREKVLQEQRDREAREKQRLLEEEMKALRGMLENDYEIEVAETKERLPITASKFSWPRTYEQCPMAGKDREFGNLLDNFLRDYAGLIVGGHKKRNLIDLAITLDRANKSVGGGTLYHEVYCGQEQCGGLIGVRCGVCHLRVVRKTE